MNPAKKCKFQRNLRTWVICGDVVWPDLFLVKYARQRQYICVTYS
jgi:hypothetical protein